MLTTRLWGGLGNQIFGIATAYPLALDNDDECAFDFDIPKIGQSNQPVHYKTNIFKKVRELNPSWVPECRYFEPRFCYDEICYQRNMWMQGYFQSEKYFINHKKEIVDLFTDRGLVAKLEHLFCRELINSIGLHVRRGDFLEPRFAEIHPCPSKDYYRRAIAFIQEKTPIGHILVFSDDIPWCKENFLDSRIIFIEGLQDYEDFYLMSLCNHNVISPSSFSWWASYLNRNEEKIVCAPDIWVKNWTKEDFKDVYYTGVNILKA